MTEIAVAELRERVGAIDATAKKAHDRIDNQDALVRQELQQLKNLIMEFRDWMNQIKGRDKVLLFAASIGGSIMGSIISAIFVYVFLKRN